MADHYAFAAQALRDAQLRALQDRWPVLSRGYDERLATHTARGLAALARIQAEHPAGRALLDELIALAQMDRRYAFLAAIPDGPIVAMARALALEEAVFGRTSDAVAELALLMGLFSLILDGMLDEAPEDLAELAPWLHEVMRGQDWATTGEPPALPPPSGRALADLLAWLTRAIIARATSSPHWRDATVRGEFSRASRAAYEAELHSTDIAIDKTLAPDLARRILEKSTSCIWAGALIPFVVHGWPAGCTPAAFEQLARAMGRFGGWIDDTVDVLEDLRANRWNAVLLEIEAAASALAVTGHPLERLARTMSIPFAAQRLPAVGTAMLDDLAQRMAETAIPGEGLLVAALDMSRACLTQAPATA